MLRAVPRQSVTLSGKEFAAILKTIVSGRIFCGPHIKDFEMRFAEYIGVKYAVALSSGRAAQYLALRSLNLDSGSEVIVPAYTFYVVPVIVKLLGLKPVFVDAQPDTYNLDPDEIEKKINPKTRCIIATHIAGLPCDIDRIVQIAKKYNLYVIEDCAEACGSEYQGRKTGSFGDAGYFSFHVSKNMTCMGGGMLVTNNDEIYRRVRELLEEYTIADAYTLWKNIAYAVITYLCTRPLIFTICVYPVILLSHVLGARWMDDRFKEKMPLSTAVVAPHIAKMTNVQAAVGIRQLLRLEEMNGLRIKNAAILYERLKGCKNTAMQEVPPRVKSTYLYFYLQVPLRKTVRGKLALRGIDSKEDGLYVCPDLDIFKDERQSYPIAEQLVNANIELPNFPSLGEKYARRIAAKTGNILDEELPFRNPE